MTRSGTVPRGGVRRPTTIGAIQAISYVMQFTLATSEPGSKGGGVYSSHCWFNVDNGKAWTLPAGSLIAMWCAPATPWYLSWLESVTDTPGGPRWLLRNLHDGRRCTWENISVKYLDPEIVAKHPEWRWTDDQQRFKKRWDRVVYRRRGQLSGPQIVALWPVFDGLCVTFGVRVKWQDDTPETTRRVSRPDFRKLKVTELQAICAEMAASFPEGAGHV